MLRYIVFLSFSVLSSIASVAQAPGDRSTRPQEKSADQRSPDNIGGGALGTAETRVSVARLRVPPKARHLYEKAVEAWGKKEPAEAQRDVDQALKIDPTYPEALTLYGFIQASLQQWGSAETGLEAAIESDPNYWPPYVILASVYNTQERYDEAQDATRRALSAGANTWSVQYEIARALIGKGDYNDALMITEEALRLKHGSLLHVAKAHALLGLRRYPEAATELRAYLQYQPSGEGSQDARHILERLQGLVSQ
ncbi:MAG TPA: tetratricopeptide repeat protein [Candidatus Sulfotelmatobacter sp.]|nr:tetratricopeptide repeat protein [Candidatus Sulfotelmatobacter sp.]